MSRTYTVQHKGREVILWSVTSRIEIFNELGMFGNIKKYYNTEEAQWIGDQSHDYIARLSQGERILEDEWNALDPRIQTVILAFMRWKKKVGFKAKFTELEVHSFRYMYAGKLDAIGYADGELGLYDWKTGFMDVERVKMQLVLYLYAYLETFPNRVIRQLRGIHFDKKSGEFDEIIITIEEAKKIFETFLEWDGRLDQDMLRTFGNMDNMKFRNKKLLGGEIMVTSSQAVAKIKQGNQSIATSTSFQNAMEMLRTWFPHAPEADRIKAGQLIWYHKAPPNKVYLVPRKNGIRAKAAGCTCDKFENCPHKDVYDYVLTVGIEVKRLIASRGRAIQYLDDSPRYMTDAEEIKILKRVDPTKIRFICKLRDAKSGAEASGWGEISKSATIIGIAQGNSLELMASYRAESKALSRLPPNDQATAALANLAVAEDTDIVEGQFSIEASEPIGQISSESTILQPEEKGVSVSGVVNTTTGELQPMPAPLREEIKQAPDKYDLMKTTCPIHNKAWKPDKWGYQHQNGKDFCKLKKLIMEQISTVTKVRGISDADVNQFILDKFGVSWGKIANDVCVDVLKAIEETFTAPSDVPNVFETQIGMQAQQLWGDVWEDKLTAIIEEKYYNINTFSELSVPQRNDLLNILQDMIIAKNEPVKQLPL